MKYIVGIREVHVSYRAVEASSQEEALQLAEDDLASEFHLEYSHTLDKDTWTVERDYLNQDE